MNFNKELFLESAKERHLISGEALMFDDLKHVDVRNVIDLDGTYEYKVSGPSRRKSLFKNTEDDKVILKRAIDVIHNNIVGQTLLKLLTIKRRLSSGKIGLVNYSGNGSRYNEIIGAVFVNLSLYQPDGSGIQERQYYSVDSGGRTALKGKSLEQSIFHELVHGLHYTSDGKYADTVLCQDSMMKGIWSDDEELRTITGRTFNKPYDPICDHVFDYSLNGEQFCPRYGHIGWKSGYDKNPPVLVTNLINQMQYLCEWKRYQLPDPILFTKPPSMSRKIQCSIGGCRPAKGVPILPTNPAIIKPRPKRNPPKVK